MQCRTYGPQNEAAARNVVDIYQESDNDTREMTLTFAICSVLVSRPSPVSRDLPFLRSRPLSGKLFKPCVYRCVQFICGEPRDPLLAFKTGDFVGCLGPAIYSQAWSPTIRLVGCS